MVLELLVDKKLIDNISDKKYQTKLINYISESDKQIKGVDNYLKFSFLEEFEACTEVNSLFV